MEAREEEPASYTVSSTGENPSNQKKTEIVDLSTNVRKTISKAKEERIAVEVEEKEKTSESQEIHERE